MPVRFVSGGRLRRSATNWSNSGLSPPRPSTDFETSCSPQGEPETRRLPRAAQLPPIRGLPDIKALTTVPNTTSSEPDGWISTPLLRQPRNPLSNRTKLLIAVGLAALPACYFMFENSDGSIEQAVAPRVALNIAPVDFFASREAQAPTAIDTTVESRIEPDVQIAPSQPTAPLDVKSAENGIKARGTRTRARASQVPSKRWLQRRRSWAERGRGDSSVSPQAPSARHR